MPNYNIYVYILDKSVFFWNLLKKKKLNRFSIYNKTAKISPKKQSFCMTIDHRIVICLNSVHKGKSTGLKVPI